jgi:hypothetical protein
MRRDRIRTLRIAFLAPVVLPGCAAPLALELAASVAPEVGVLGLTAAGAGGLSSRRTLPTVTETTDENTVTFLWRVAKVFTPGDASAAREAYKVRRSRYEKLDWPYRSLRLGSGERVWAQLPNPDTWVQCADDRGDCPQLHGLSCRGSRRLHPLNDSGRQVTPAAMPTA